MSARSSDPGLGVFELLALWLLGAIAAASLVVWSVGAVAARVFGGAWPTVTASEMPSVVSRLGSHLSDPGTAWPARDRLLMPGPVLFYATAVVLVAIIVTVAIVGYRLFRPNVRKGRGARWASTGDLKQLLLREHAPGRLIVGSSNGKLIAAEPRQSVIVFGPTQTMKTTGLAVPAILEWDGPVIATSVKTDLLRDTLEARRARDGAVWIYDPVRCTGLPRNAWSPLPMCTTWSGAQRTANWLCAAASRGPNGIENAAFWYAAAAKLLAPLLHAASIGGGSMHDVIHWIDTKDKHDNAILDILHYQDAAEAEAAYRASMGREERTKSSVYTTTETVLQAYSDPAVLDCAEFPEITPDTLFDGRQHTLYLAAPAHEQRRLQPLFATLIQEFISSAYDRSSRTGKPLDAPLLLVLDECANIAPLRDLATLASTGAGQGIQLVTVFQDLAQVESVYGRGDAATIVSNHRAKVVLSGIADPATLDYAARLLGDEEVQQLSATRGYQGGQSTTESTTYRHLASGHELRQMEPGSGLLVYGHLPPARIRLRPWFRDKRLRQLVECPGGQTAS